uniref:Uncharacterized protein n=1 Tax=Amphimedon queenslandica TaxID=400682 RepID=A0A1X7TJS7_AMPQE
MILKFKMNDKKSDVPQLVSKLKELARDQFQQFQNAFLNKGEFVLKETYCSMGITESQWHRIYKESCKSCIWSFHNKLPVRHATSTCSPTVAHDPFNSSFIFTTHDPACTSQGPSNPTCLSVSLEAAVEYSSLLPDIMQGMWSKATKLLSTDGAIAPAPGYSSGSHNVLSTSKTGFHAVKQTRNA